MLILLVEDNRFLAEAIKGAFPEQDIVTVGSLQKAKEALGRYSFGLVILDLGLPDSHGLDTLRALSDSPTPKVVLTGDDRLACEAAKLGAVDYICKQDSNRDTLERLAFNITRYTPKPRFKPRVLEELKVCIAHCREHAWVG